MSTNPVLKKSLYIISVPLVIILSIIILGLWNSESASKMKHYWKVYQVNINGEDITDQFRTKSLSFLDNEKLLLPIHKDSKATLPLKYCIWKHKRKGIFHGIIEIKDLRQSIFDGTYEIEILNHSEPQFLKLTSEKIEIYLQGIERFSHGNQNIETQYEIRTLD